MQYSDINKINGSLQLGKVRGYVLSFVGIIYIPLSLPYPPFFLPPSLSPSYTHTHTHTYSQIHRLHTYKKISQMKNWVSDS